jgi:DNA-binding GntR family transcriptional regulator
MTETVAGNFMDMPALDPDSPLPLWRQLADRMRDEITSGRVTGRVPSAGQLAPAYGVSRDTALKALATLRDEGLIVTTPGRGSFVRRERES